MRQSVRFLTAFFLVLMLALATEMGPRVAEAVKYPNCRQFCQVEGYTHGQGLGEPPRCHCINDPCADGFIYYEEAITKTKVGNNISYVATDPLCGWKVPRRGEVKLNIDGAWNKDDNTGAGGGVIRNDLGQWTLGFCSKFTAFSAEEAELTAFRNCLQSAWLEDINSLVIETDALGIKQLHQLDQPVASTHHALAPIINEVLHLLHRDWVVTISHAPRQSNKVAHTLAEHCLQMQDQYATFGDAPHFVKKEYENDRDNVVASANCGSSSLNI